MFIQRSIATTSKELSPPVRVHGVRLSVISVSSLKTTCNAATAPGGQSRSPLCKTVSRTFFSRGWRRSVASARVVRARR